MLLSLIAAITGILAVAPIVAGIPSVAAQTTTDDEEASTTPPPDSDSSSDDEGTTTPTDDEEASTNTPSEDEDNVQGNRPTETTRPNSEISSDEETRTTGAITSSQDDVKAKDKDPILVCDDGSTPVNGKCYTGTPTLEKCADGSTPVNGKCPTNPVQKCPDGSNAVSGKCEKGTPLCPPSHPIMVPDSSGEFRCARPAISALPNGGCNTGTEQYDSQRQLCYSTQNSPCPEGYKPNLQTNKCEANPVLKCADNTNPAPDGKCYTENPVLKCADGSDPVNGKCETEPRPGCRDPGYVLDSSKNKCVKA